MENKKTCNDFKQLNRAAQLGIVTPVKTLPNAYLIHGLSGSPAVMEPLTTILKHRGFSVTVPMLAGHAGSGDGLLTTRWEEWIAPIERDLRSLVRKKGPIALGGLSLGGVIAAYITSQHPTWIQSLTLMAPAFFISPWVSHLAIPVLRRAPFRNWYPWSTKTYENSVADPEGLERYKTLGHSRMAIYSIAQMLDLSALTQRTLGSIVAPTLLVHSTGDQVTPIRNIEWISRHIGSPIVEAMVVRRSKHVLPLDYDREIIGHAMADFIEQHIEPIRIIHE